MTNRNSLLGRSRPSEKLTRGEIAALDKVTVPPAPAAKSPGKKGGGPQRMVRKDLLKFRWSLECPGCGFKVTGNGQPQPGQRLARCGRCKVVLVLGGGWEVPESPAGRDEAGKPFAFAGLWASWRDPEGEMVRSCTIVTTEANGVLRPIHDWMPVLLSRDAESLWLDDDLQDPGLPGSVLSPYPADLMEAYRVSALVNRPSNDGPEVAAPVVAEVPPFQGDQADPPLF